MSVVVGIDPGVTGALAVFVKGQLVHLLDIAHIKDGNKAKKRIDIRDLVATVKMIVSDAGATPIVAYLEQAHAMPKQGVSSMFAYGRTNGVIEGVLAACGIDNVRKVVPAVWKRRLGLLGNNQPKHASIRKAKHFYPYAPIELAKHHNRAEAVLIGHYGCLVNGAQK